MREKQPNLIYVFGDQWRAQAFGYAGDPNVRTPVVDAFARQAVNFTHAVSGYPVCSPYRASLMTGQYPSTHGMIVNDQRLLHLAQNYSPKPPRFLAEAFNDGGYQTGWIGKWHIDGQGRGAYVPPERRLGFGHWQGFECNHHYNKSAYYETGPEKVAWEGYDAIAQTHAACRYIESAHEKPFALFLSWGPPHDPYETAPEQYRALYDPAALELRANVPAAHEAQARRDLAGYYAHCTALDDCFGSLLAALDRSGHAADTIVVWTSDHGDMLQSHGAHGKQRPWDESIRVPLLVRDPFRTVPGPATTDSLIDAPDMMPTLLGLCGVPIPASVEGLDFSPVIRSGAVVEKQAALLALNVPFHQWRWDNGGRELRGLRTRRYTYVRDLRGPWLLYDNDTDPYQMRNLVDNPAHAAEQGRLDALLLAQLAARGDEFRPGREYFAKYDIRLNEGGDVAYDG